MSRYFVTGTGTGIGKTFVTRALARAGARRAMRVAALKPLETGCNPQPADAFALERAALRSDLARAPGLYRAPLPLAPYAATLAGTPPPPPLSELASTIEEHVRDADLALVEGAGGLLVPYDAERTLADLALALAYPLILIAPDGLGVLSHTLTAYEAAERRGLAVAAVILTRHNLDPKDKSAGTNQRILAERIDAPVRSFPRCDDDDEALANAADSWEILPEAFGSRATTSA
jgi:dethiobiotin synthetase